MLVILLSYLVLGLVISTSYWFRIFQIYRKYVDGTNYEIATAIIAKYWVVMVRDIITWPMTSILNWNEKFEQLEESLRS